VCKSAIREVLAFRHRLQFKSRLGFSDIVVDLNGVVRRSLLFLTRAALPSPLSFRPGDTEKTHSRYYLYIK